MPRVGSMVTVALASIGIVGVLGLTTNDYLKRQFPSQVLELRNRIGQDVFRKLWNGIVVIHLGEGAYTLLTCVHRGWYSPINTIKWTLSSILFGFGSLKQLKKHANDVAGIKKSE
jgi:hypothetical protein